MNKTVAVIGSGFAGLSAACFLAKAGYNVTVLEKNSTPGGRCRLWEQKGFTFDMGPSWYWMPDIFEKFFSQFGKKPSQYYTLTRLNPSYRVFFKKDFWDIPAGANELGELLETKEAGAAKNLTKFLAEAAYKYKVGINELVYKPGRSLTEFIDYKLLKGMLKLDVFSSMQAHIGSYFKNPEIRQLLEFPVLFLGAKPANTPALYSLMNYADIELGTWYPMGGMYKIVEGMVALATELGVKFVYEAEVKKIETLHGKAERLVTTKGNFIVDIVVAGADYHHVDTKLLDKQANYSEAYWQKRVMAPGSLIFYLGINKKIDGLLHHTLFFDEDFTRHAEEIYDEPQWPQKPLFYISTTSKTDDTVAPEGCENVMILIPVAPGLEDNDETRERYYTMVMDRLEGRLGQSIRPHVVVKRSYAHRDFVADYHAFKGNAYGLANTLRQTAILKPALKNKKLSNLYYTGQLTVPGPGVPPSLISGQVVAAEVQKEFPISTLKN
jgi:phytoene desaturase